MIAVPAHDAHSDRVLIDMVSAVVDGLNDGVVLKRGVKLFRSSSQALASGSITAVQFTSLVTIDGSADVDGMTDLAGNPTRVTFVTPGWYRVSGAIAIPVGEGASSLDCEAIIRKNGSSILARESQEGDSLLDTRLSVCVTDLFAAGDYVELCGFQNSGFASNMLAGAEYGNYLRVSRR